MLPLISKINANSSEKDGRDNINQKEFELSTKDNNE